MRYNFSCFSRSKDLESPFVQCCLSILRVDDACPSPSMRLLRRKTAVFVPASVEIMDAAISFAAPRDRRHRIEDHFELGFRRLQLVECTPQQDTRSFYFACDENNMAGAFDQLQIAGARGFRLGVVN